MTKKVLIVSKCPTHPTNAGNRNWILSQAVMLKQMGCDVHFLFINEFPIRKDKQTCIDALSQVKAYWKEKCHIYNVDKLQKIRIDLLKYYRMKFCNWHYHVDDNYPYGIEKMVNRLDEEHHFDICIINYYYLSRLFDYIKIPKKAIATHDCIAYKNLKTKGNTMCITADTEARAMQRCPHIFALQDIEANYFHLLSPNSIVYNFYGCFEYHSRKIIGNKNIVFLSGNNEYNQNGIKWFVNYVWPLIKSQHSDAQLLIAGSICKTIKNLECVNGIKLLGYIDNPADFYALGDVAINPIYQGTGLKIKTFEAISYDKVTIVHPHSMDGVFHKDEAPLFASDNPKDWVNYLDKIWGHPDKIAEIKIRNKAYLDEMNKFIINEYKRFLNS